LDKVEGVKKADSAKKNIENRRGDPGKTAIAGSGGASAEQMKPGEKTSFG